MKMAKESEIEKSAKKSKRARKSSLAGVSLTEADGQLFESLRALRMEIAKKEKVPPYVVFSDKTLIHMCAAKPKTKEEMLAISGVGEFKYEKYGEIFINTVSGGIR